MIIDGHNHDDGDHDDRVCLKGSSWQYGPSPTSIRSMIYITAICDDNHDDHDILQYDNHDRTTI